MYLFVYLSIYWFMYVYMQRLIDFLFIYSLIK